MLCPGRHPSSPPTPRHFCPGRNPRTKSHLSERAMRGKVQVSSGSWFLFSDWSFNTSPGRLHDTITGDNGAPLSSGEPVSASALLGSVSEVQYLAERERLAHQPSHSRRGEWWEVAASLSSAQRVLICEFQVPVPAISDLADLRQLSPTSEPQFSFCKMRRLQDSDPPRCHLHAEVLPL